MKKQLMTSGISILLICIGLSGCFENNNSVITLNIQDEINKASPMDTIYIPSGLYKENWIIINKSITLIGENKENTIISGNPDKDDYINVLIHIKDTSDVNIQGFTICNREGKDSSSGIWIDHSNNCSISKNILKNLDDGIRITKCSNTVIWNNIFFENEYGISLDGDFNKIYKNHFYENDDWLHLINGEYNKFYNNNFGYCTKGVTEEYKLIWDKKSFTGFCCSGNTWDMGNITGGNYWYYNNGSDSDGNGFVDNPYLIYYNPPGNYTEEDRYPFINQLELNIGEEKYK